MQNRIMALFFIFSACFLSFTKVPQAVVTRVAGPRLQGPAPVIPVLKTGSLSVSKRSAGLSGTPYIIIDKSDYELSVYDDEGWYATYPAVFGNKSLGDKMMEGDRKTPEGTYRIVSKRPHEKWNKIMLIDYPTPSDREKFNERKAKGLVPRNASIGGGIGIHGTWNRDEMAVDYFQNWTNGCISIKREDMDELYSIIPIGTKVTIRR